jgi:hypothetical protein
MVPPQSGQKGGGQPVTDRHHMRLAAALSAMPFGITYVSVTCARPVIDLLPAP